MLSTIYLLSALAFFVGLVAYYRRGLANPKGSTGKVVLFAYAIPAVLTFGAVYSTGSYAVKCALLRDPMILDELSARYSKAKESAQEKEGQKALKKLSARDYERAPVLGNLTGDVTVLEFYDYTCGYCQRAFAAAKAMLDSDKGVKLVLVNFVINPQVGTLPARASMAAAKQGQDKLAKLHEALFTAKLVPEGATEANIVEKQTALIMDLAKKAGLNVEQLKKDMADSAIDQELEGNRALAVKLGITGTPAFVIGNHKLIPGAVPAYTLLEAVEAARAKK